MHRCTESVEKYFDALDRCSHTKCLYHQQHKNVRTSAKSVKVLHHHAEKNGSRHVCRALSTPIDPSVDAEGRANQYKGDYNCVCKCYNPGQLTISSLKKKQARLARELQK